MKFTKSLLTAALMATSVDAVLIPTTTTASTRLLEMTTTGASTRETTTGGTIEGPLVGIPTNASARDKTTTTGGTIVEEEEADGRGFFGNKKKPTSAPMAAPTSSPTREPGIWVANDYGFDCDDACSFYGGPGFDVCNAPTAHPLVNTEAKFRYVVEVELGVTGLPYPYAGGTSPLYPGFTANAQFTDGVLNYNTNPATATTCTGSDPNVQRVCCCGPTTGLVCRVE